MLLDSTENCHPCLNHPMCSTRDEHILGCHIWKFLHWRNLNSDKRITIRLVTKYFLCWKKKFGLDFFPIITFHWKSISHTNISHEMGLEHICTHPIVKLNGKLENSFDYFHFSWVTFDCWGYEMITRSGTQALLIITFRSWKCLYGFEDFNAFTSFSFIHAVVKWISYNLLCCTKMTKPEEVATRLNCELEVIFENSNTSAEINEHLKKYIRFAFIRRYVKWAIFMIIFIAVLSSSICYIPSLNWNASAIGRLTLIQFILPFFNWQYLYNSRCLIAYPLEKRIDKVNIVEFDDLRHDECVVCENLGNLNFQFSISYSKT